MFTGSKHAIEPHVTARQCAPGSSFIRVYKRAVKLFYNKKCNIGKVKMRLLIISMTHSPESLELMLGRLHPPSHAV
jgi:hypothetical protein